MTHNITIVLDLHFSSVCDILSSFGWGGGAARTATSASHFYLDFKVFR